MTFPDPQVRAYLNEHFVCVRLDFETDGEAFAELGLSAIPAMAVGLPGQPPRALQEGALDPGPFLDWLVAAKVGSARE